MSFPTPAKSLPRLASLDNFRDIAGVERGYEANGGSLRRGVVFRSNRVEVTPDDLALLEEFGLVAIRDLRERAEVSQHPNTQVRGSTWHHHPVSGIANSHVLAFTTADQTYNAMLNYYRTFVNDAQNRNSFRDLIHGLAREKSPQVVHCSAGKDRTGWATVLIHHILGVNRETLIGDYLLTDEYAFKSRRATLDVMLETTESSLAPVYEPAVRCDIRYLDAAFAEVDRLYGDLNAYLAEGLGVNGDVISAIRSQLTAGG